MRVERLVSMVNDIARFFNGEPDKDEAARGVANHLKRFWEPRMRREILEHYSTGGHGLDDLARSGVALLAEETKQD